MSKYITNRRFVDDHSIIFILANVVGGVECERKSWFHCHGSSSSLPRKYKSQNGLEVDLPGHPYSTNHELPATSIFSC